MSLFGKIVRTAINVATLPVAVVRDAVTLAGLPLFAAATEAER